MTLPKKLYKFEPFNELSLRNLKRQNVYFGSPKNFNDPYDCAITAQVKELTPEQIETYINNRLNKALPIGERNNQQKHLKRKVEVILKNLPSIIDEHRDKYVSKIGITCFSECNDNLLMWAHYGGRYKGFCLEFDLNQPLFEKAKKITYQNDMPQIDPIKLLENDEQVFRQLFEDLFCIKSKLWEYEKEWRVLHEEVRPFHYPPEALTGVFFGPDIEPECLEIIALILRGQNENVKLFKGKRSHKEFKVEYEEVQYIPHLEAKKLGLIKD